MKGRCVRWDGDGKATWPRWTGSAWEWRDAHGNEVSTPPKSRVLIQGDVYFICGCFYADDGGTPDPVGKGAFVTRPLRIPRYTRAGRDYPLDELKADIDFWLAAQPSAIEQEVSQLSRKPSDSSRFKAVEALRPKAED